MAFIARWSPVAASLVVLATALFPSTARAVDPLAASARAEFVLGERFGPDFRWQFGVRVHVTDRGSGRGLANLRLAAAGYMNEPGMEMRTVPAKLTSSGGGWYEGSLAFYMPGAWSIRMEIGGASVVPHVATVRLFIPVSR